MLGRVRKPGKLYGMRTNNTTTRHDLTDQQWARLAPLLPPQRSPKGSKGGKPFVDHRRVINGLLWLDRTGAPWRDIPARYGPWSTIASRFYRWQARGLWQRILDTLQQDAEAHGTLDWETHYVDGTVIRAHQHAAGAKGGIRRRKRSAAVRAVSRRRSISGRRAAASR